MTKNRLEAFSDGVFAIVITLLVLEIRPEGAGLDGWTQFLHVLPKILLFVLSFILVGLYWVSHHNMLHFVERVDRGLLWWNLLLLLAVAFIPFPTALLGATGADAGSLVIYCGVLALSNLMGGLMWVHATRQNRLVHAAFPADFGRFVVRLHLSPIAVYGLAALLAPFWRTGTLVLIGLIPAFFVLPNRWIERRVRAAHATIHGAR